MLNTALGAYDPFCFQVKLLRLTTSKPIKTPLKFAVYKGIIPLLIDVVNLALLFYVPTAGAPMEQTKQTFTMTGSSVDLEETSLYFTLPNFDPRTTVEFTLSILDASNKQPLATSIIETLEPIRQFKASQKNFHEYTISLPGGFQIEYLLFVDKSRLNLLESIKKLDKERSSLGSQQFLESQDSQFFSSSLKKIPYRKSESAAEVINFSPRVYTQPDDEKSVTSETKIRSSRQLQKLNSTKSTTELIGTGNKRRETNNNPSKLTGKEESVISQIIYPLIVVNEIPLETPKQSIIEPPAPVEDNLNNSQTLRAPKPSSRRVIKEQPDLEEESRILKKKQLEELNSNKKTKLAILGVVILMFLLLLAPRMFGNKKPQHKKQTKTKKRATV